MIFTPILTEYDPSDIVEGEVVTPKVLDFLNSYFLKYTPGLADAILAGIISVTGSARKGVLINYGLGLSDSREEFITADRLIIINSDKYEPTIAMGVIRWLHENRFKANLMCDFKLFMVWARENDQRQRSSPSEMIVRESPPHIDKDKESGTDTAVGFGQRHFANFATIIKQTGLPDNFVRRAWAESGQWPWYYQALLSQLEMNFVIKWKNVRSDRPSIRSQSSESALRNLLIGRAYGWGILAGQPQLFGDTVAAIKISDVPLSSILSLPWSNMVSSIGLKGELWPWFFYGDRPPMDVLPVDSVDGLRALGVSSPDADRLKFVSVVDDVAPEPSYALSASTPDTVSVSTKFLFT